MCTQWPVKQPGLGLKSIFQNTVFYMWTEPKQIQKKGVHLHIYNFGQKEMRKYFKLVSRMQHTVISISFRKLILQHAWTLDFLTSLSLDMHILANTQHAHKRTWPDVLNVCYTPSNETHPSFETNTHIQSHTSLLLPVSSPRDSSTVY